MPNKYEHLLIPDSPVLATAGTILTKMESLCRDYVTSSERKSEQLDMLHSLFWQSLFEIMPACIDRDNKEAFVIPHDVMPWVDFGCVSAGLAPNYQAITSLGAVPQIPHALEEAFAEYEVFYFSGWLKRCYENTLQLGRKRLLSAEHDDLAAELKDYPRRIADAEGRRTAFVRRYPAAVRVKQISEEIDSRLPEYNMIKEKIERSERVTTPERIRYVQLNDELSTLRETRTREQQYISDKVPQQEMMRLDREIEEIIVRRYEIEKKVIAADHAVREDARWRSEMTLTACVDAVKEEIRRVRTLTEIIAKRTHQKQCSVLASSQQRIPSPVEIVAAIEETLEIDPSLFHKSTESSYPAIVLIPAIGDGVFDYERNAFFIPLHPTKDIMQSVAMALLDHHLDSPHWGRYRDSYLKLKKNRGVTSSITLRDTMVRDYLGWLTMEARGYQVLEPDTRKWFFENIAPPLFAIQQPRRLADIAVPEARTRIQMYEEYLTQDPQDVETLFHLGVIHWKLGHFAQAYDVFTKAHALQPDNVPICYNAALSTFKNGQKDKAIQLWKHYLTLDKASFWVGRVQNFMQMAKEG